MKMTLCPYCMKEAAEEICPHCGKPVAYGGEPAHLQAGFVLNGTHPYILGAALGQGGFGITYIALDMVTNQRVAIKEYYPTYCAVRSDARTVTFYRGQEEVYNKGRDRFLDEARVLKSLSDIKSIVNVRDFFEANNTAYLVMEFLEGDSLKSHAQKHGKFPAQEFLGKLRPLMEDIERMHQRGVVHRDIAPDNIILTPDGQMKLIDFGAARSYVGDKSMTVVVKKGFAPIEQYMRHGSTAATDVYALAATIYYCTTGTVPPDSAERQYEEDMLKSPISLGAELSKEQERAILKALEVQPKKRTQSVAELIKALEHAPKPEKPKPVKKTEKPKAESKKNPKWIIPAIAAVLLCVLGTVLFMGKAETPVTPAESQPQQMEVPETTVPETEPPVILSEEAQKYNEAVDFFNNGEYGKAAIAFAKLGDYRDAKKISKQIWDAMTDEETISLGARHTLGLKKDGTVVAAGSNLYGECEVSGWTDIVAISAETEQTVGLKADGTVVAAGNNEDGRCDVSGWTDIVAINAGAWHTVGLKTDGTVVAVGRNDFGSCNVSSWKGIVDITGSYHTVGLKEDGAVMATGRNLDSECEVSAWRDIVAISAEVTHTVGLKEDGTVVAVGSNFGGKCEVSDWTDIVAISTGGHTVGLKVDGTVVAAGINSDGQCNVSGWTDIVAISTGIATTVGLKADGTVVAVGSNSGGECEVSEWTDIVAISTNNDHTVGLKADGTVVAVGNNDDGQCDVSGWKDIRLPTIPEERLSEIKLSYITEE